MSTAYTITIRKPETAGAPWGVDVAAQGVIYRFGGDAMGGPRDCIDVAGAALRRLIDGGLIRVQSLAEEGWNAVRGRARMGSRVTVQDLDTPASTWETSESSTPPEPAALEDAARQARAILAAFMDATDAQVIRTKHDWAGRLAVTPHVSGEVAGDDEVSLGEIGRALDALDAALGEAAGDEDSPEDEPADQP